MSDRRIAVVGATGAVGRTMIEVLGQRDFPLADLRLLASARSAGSSRQHAVGRGRSRGFGGCRPVGHRHRLVLGGGGSARGPSRRHSSKSGAVVIDNSSAFRGRSRVPAGGGRSQ